MAELADPVRQAPKLIELRGCSARELDPLLLDETVEWDRELDWDFGKSADLVRRYTDSRSLVGLALTVQDEVVGYGYSVLDDNKGLIGDIYMRELWRDTDSELRLFRGLLDGLMAVPKLRRIETQLMMIGPEVARALQRERFIKLYERLLMRLPESTADLPPGNPKAQLFTYEPWRDGHLDAGATLVTQSYANHVDSLINDQYVTVSGARRFLTNIVQFPGCGVFYQPGSFLAFDPQTGLIKGMVLTSFVAHEVGHVTQICVTPEARGTGLGYELLRRALRALRQNGARRITLTVTASNELAVQLYLRCGFSEVRRFFAYVWDGYAPAS